MCVITVWCVCDGGGDDCAEECVECNTDEQQGGSAAAIETGDDLDKYDSQQRAYERACRENPRRFRGHASDDENNGYHCCTGGDTGNTGFRQWIAKDCLHGCACDSERGAGQSRKEDAR
ncbi:hypothetical protein JCM7447_01250 [Corynebacterium amycolatum]